LSIIIKILVLTIAALSAHADQIELSRMRPTQMKVGVAAVDTVEALDRKSLKSGESLQEHIVSQLAKHPPSAVIGPKGVVYITDGHHRTLEAYRLHLKSIPVHIEKDFSGPGQEQLFYRYMAEHSEGYFTQEVRRRFQNVNPASLQYEKMYQSLPKDFGELAKADSPERSVIAKIFFDLGVKAMSPPFVDYVEFLIAERLECKLAVKSHHEYDSDTLDRARRAVFKGAKAEELLRSLVQPGFAPQGREIIEKARAEGLKIAGADPVCWKKCTDAL
jgi:hypothetical protein